MAKSVGGGGWSRPGLFEATRVLSDAQWRQIEPRLPGTADRPGATARDNRLFIEAVLWIARTGAPWRDLPPAFGNWNSNFQRFGRWAKSGLWWEVFEALAGDPNFDYRIADSRIVWTGQHTPARRSGLRIIPKEEARPVPGADPVSGEYEKFAKNLLKGALKTRGVTYGQLAESLAGIGVFETEASLGAKINRGGFSAAFMIQCLVAAGCTGLRLLD